MRRYLHAAGVTLVVIGWGTIISTAITSLFKPIDYVIAFWAVVALYWFEAMVDLLAPPLAVLLFCPSCKVLHVDKPDPRIDWKNRPHRAHLCHACGCIWPAANVDTTGVPLEEIAPSEHETIQRSVSVPLNKGVALGATAQRRRSF